MLDFSFGELTIIGAVALVVLGPEKLPKVARTVGLWVSKAQRYVNDVKADINREVDLAELRKMQQQVEESARELKKTVDDNLQTVHNELDAARHEVRSMTSEAEAEIDAALNAHPVLGADHDPYHAFAHGEFIKPAPTVESLAAEVESLRGLLAGGQMPVGFKYAPRARAARPRRALRKSAS